MSKTYPHNYCNLHVQSHEKSVRALPVHMYTGIPEKTGLRKYDIFGGGNEACCCDMELQCPELNWIQTKTKHIHWEFPFWTQNPEQ